MTRQWFKRQIHIIHQTPFTSRLYSHKKQHDSNRSIQNENIYLTKTFLFFIGSRENFIKKETPLCV